MDSAVMVGILSLAGTLIGTLGGILASSKLTSHRLGELEKKVDKHNHLVERMVKVEASASSAHRRMDGIEDRMKG